MDNREKFFGKVLYTMPICIFSNHGGGWMTHQIILSRREDRGEPHGNSIKRDIESFLGMDGVEQVSVSRVVQTETDIPDIERLRKSLTDQNRILRLPASISTITMWWKLPGPSLPLNVVSWRSPMSTRHTSTGATCRLS